LAAAAFILSARVWAADAPLLPFQVSWTTGTCASCETARSVGSVQFAHDRDAWALGYNPPGETGAGDWSILHTRDGGLTWRELPSSFQHNEPPSLSFVSAREGWTMVFDMAMAEQRLMLTRDAGASWRRLPLRDLYVRGGQYLGHGLGFTYSLKPNAQAYLYATTDYGRRWRVAPLPPGLFRVDALAFANARVGLLAGCIGGRTVIMRTGDGGRHWSTKVLDLPLAPRFNPGCDAEVEGLSLGANGRAGFLVQKTSFANGDTSGFASAWTSSDGGLSWTRTFQAVFRESLDRHTWFDGPYLLNGQSVLIFKVASGDKASVLYSKIGGGAWAEAPLTAPISGCSAASGGLTCSGGTGGFLLARITAARSR
jgi:photosystem II stability/assembly factor-like uncharacterized protein